MQLYHKDTTATSTLFLSSAVLFTDYSQIKAIIYITRFHTFTPFHHFRYKQQVIKQEAKLSLG